LWKTGKYDTCVKIPEDVNQLLGKNISTKDKGKE
jgi:hypothetical protein